MAKCKLLIVYALLLGSVFAQEDPLYERVRRLYVEKGFGERGDSIPNPKSPYWEDLEWYNEQGIKVRPALIRLLKEEYDGDYRQMAELVFTLKRLGGDQTDALEYIRGKLEELKDFPEDQIRTSHVDRFLIAAFSFLGVHGNSRSDVELIESFQDFPERLTGYYSSKDSNFLAKRLAESNVDDDDVEGDMESIDEVDTTNDRDKKSVLKSNEPALPESGGHFTGKAGQWLIYALSVIGVVIFAAVFFRFYKDKN